MAVDAATEWTKAVAMNDVPGAWPHPLMLMVAMEPAKVLDRSTAPIQWTCCFI